jgi:hypothetical protein
MALRLTEAELAGNIHTVLARVRDEGLEVIVVQGSKPVAIIRRPEGPGRMARKLDLIESTLLARLVGSLSMANSSSCSNWCLV